MKVWIYKGDILPYKVSIDDKITREAAMAVGETSGQARPRRLIMAGGGRRRQDQGEPGSVVEDDVGEGVEEGVEVGAEMGAEEGMGVLEEAPVGTPAEPSARELLEEPTEPDELERRLAQDEQMERQTRHEHHEAPHFRRESD